MCNRFLIVPYIKIMKRLWARRSLLTLVLWAYGLWACLVTQLGCLHGTQITEWSGWAMGRLPGFPHLGLKFLPWEKPKLPWMLKAPGIMQGQAVASSHPYSQPSLHSETLTVIFLFSLSLFDKYEWRKNHITKIILTCTTLQSDNRISWDFPGILACSKFLRGAQQVLWDFLDFHEKFISMRVAETWEFWLGITKYIN